MSDQNSLFSDIITISINLINHEQNLIKKQLKLTGTVNNHVICVMIDTGSQACIISPIKCNQLKLETIKLLKPRSITLRKASHKESHLIVELTEGKNREIRRMFEALGTEVTALKRIAFGKLKLGTLEPGQFKAITKKEIL